MALLTAAGLLGSLLTGDLKGYGAQVGLRWVPGQGATLGFDPLFYGTAKLPIDGITLGTTALASPLSHDPAIMRYEAGHIPGYNAFGVAYPLLSQASDLAFALDPAGPAVPLMGYMPTTGRTVNPSVLPRQFHNFYLDFGKRPAPPDIESTIAIVKALAATPAPKKIPEYWEFAPIEYTSRPR